MARRFGGKHSPRAEGPAQPEAARVTPAMAGHLPDPGVARPNLLFVASLPLLVTAFFQGAVGMAVDLSAFGLLALAAWLTRDGIRAQAAYDARKVARRPAIPRKLFGTFLTGLGVALAAFKGGAGAPEPVVASVLAPAILGFLSAALHLVAFGPDPLGDKGMEGVDRFQTERVARAVSAAQDELDAMSDALRRAREPALEARLEKFQATVRQLLIRVEDDPRDLSAARKYLGIYLRGAREATVKFADLYSGNRDADARAAYQTLLDDLDADFAAKSDKLLQDNRTDLDIEIEVLRERLQREGVRAE